MNPGLKGEACRCSVGSPAFGGMTFRPTRNVAGRCRIGWPSVATTLALKAVPARTVCAIYRSAARALPTRVLWVDRDHRHASQRCFVGQEGPKLGEGPAMMRAALRLSHRCPGADVGQVLDPYAASGVLSLPHDSLADPVVEVAGKPRLFSPALLEQPLGRVRSLLLKLSAQPGLSGAQVRDVRAREHLTVAIGGNVLESEVYAEISGWIVRRHIANVHRHEQVELSVASDQVGLPPREGAPAGRLRRATAWLPVHPRSGWKRGPALSRTGCAGRRRLPRAGGTSA